MTLAFIKSCQQSQCVMFLKNEKLAEFKLPDSVVMNETSVECYTESSDHKFIVCVVLARLFDSHFICSSSACWPVTTSRTSCC